MSDPQPLSDQEYLEAQDRLVELMWADDATPEGAERQRLSKRCRAFERDVLHQAPRTCLAGDEEDVAAQLGSVRLVVRLPAHLRTRLQLEALADGRTVSAIIEDAVTQALARAGEPPPDRNVPTDDTPAAPLRVVLPVRGSRSGS